MQAGATREQQGKEWPLGEAAQAEQFERASQSRRAVSRDQRMTRR